VRQTSACCWDPMVPRIKLWSACFPATPTADKSDLFNVSTLNYSWRMKKTSEMLGLEWLAERTGKNEVKVSAPLLPTAKSVPKVKVLPLEVKPLPVPKTDARTVIPLQDRVNQLNRLWHAFNALAYDLGLQVQPQRVSLVETHCGYVLDARASALKIREMMNDFRRIWPAN
jgi:hypothetical protein